MKTKAEVLKLYKSDCLDGRDITRLGVFSTPEEWKLLGLEPVDGFDIESHKPLEWNRQNIINCLDRDLSFAFEKALGGRGISSSLMNDVIKMWMWILDDPLQNHSEYRHYGLPLLKAVALKYNLPNEIGDDEGTEDKYNGFY